MLPDPLDTVAYGHSLFALPKLVFPPPPNIILDRTLCGFQSAKNDRGLFPSKSWGGQHNPGIKKGGVQNGCACAPQNFENHIHFPVNILKFIYYRSDDPGLQ